MDGGCENCGFLGMEGDKDRCLECTTVSFQGMISVMDPASSWCAKWLHLGREGTPNDPCKRVNKLHA